MWPLAMYSNYFEWDVYSSFLLKLIVHCSTTELLKRLGLLKQLRYVYVSCCLRLNTVPYGCQFSMGSKFLGFCEVFLSSKISKFFIYGV